MSHRRPLAVLLVLLALTASDAFVERAVACPMCGQANETSAGTTAEEAARPKAYMYSILFMLSMPALIFGGFGVVIYRTVRAARIEDAAADDSFSD
jgi:hypothetical protein